MSQSGPVTIQSGNLPPTVPLEFVTNSGTAVASGNVLNVLGGTNCTTSGSGDTITINVTASGTLQTLTGNSGGQISPTLSNINTVGSGSITIIGSGSTLTTQLTGLTNHALQVGAGTSTLTQLSLGSSGQVLQSGGASANPAWSTATYPSTTTVNQILYSSSANVINGIATGNNGVLITGTTGIPSILAAGTTGQILTATTGSPPSWASPATSGTVTTVSVVSANGFAGTVANASSTPAITLTTTQTGLLSGNGTAITGTAITQYNVLTGSASNAPNNVAPSATSGVPLISQGSSSQPVFGTALVAGGGTGAVTLTGVLTGNGTSAITASAVTQYALLVGGASNAVGSVADVATGQVLTSGGVSANPSYSAYPQISGLGIGASPGSTAGLTFDGSNFMNAYSTGTFTPTVYGASTTGTTTYSAQNGYYTVIGNMVFLIGTIVITAATGTGIATIGGLPFTVKNQTNGNSVGTFLINGSGWAWAASTTNINCQAIPNTTTLNMNCIGNGVGAIALTMSNAAVTMRFTIIYQM